jgi:NAD(P)-dependent dehydrogenase (short-subunit alcohol dehydrogenase family)
MVAPSTELALSDWQRTIDINLTGSFLCWQAAGRVMLAQGRGAIVNIGSLTSFLGFPQRTAYAASKGGVIQFAKALAVEWAPQGVRVFVSI